MTLLAGSGGVVLWGLLVLGVARAARTRPPQRDGFSAQAPDLGEAPRQPDPYVGPLFSPARARWYRWWRCSERQRAESGRGLPLLASESCWEPTARPSFREGVAARNEQLEDVGGLVRFYVMVHTAEERRSRAVPTERESEPASVGKSLASRSPLR